LSTLFPAVIFPETTFHYVAWPLLFGPNLKGASGDISSYIASLICLFPLAWMGIVKATTIAPKPHQRLATTSGLFVFVCSAVFTGFLYSLESAIVYKFSRVALLHGTALSITLHLIVFAAIFVVLQMCDHLARRTRSPRAVQIASRALIAVCLLAVIVRKVLLYAIAFNNSLADLYSILFSIVGVLYVVPSLCNRNQDETGVEEPTIARPLHFTFFVKQLSILAAVAVIFMSALRLVRFDWNQLIGSLSVLLVWCLIFWFCSGFGRRHQREYRALSLIVIALPISAALAVLLVPVSGTAANYMSGKMQESLDQYMAYNPSIYVMENVLRPAVNDSTDEDYYRFLNKHANIEAAVEAPDISFVDNFDTARGPKPNVFLFVIDALRRDYLSPYNPRVSFTPNIQRFAEESVVFKDPMTHYGGTALAEPAIWTGVQSIHKHYPSSLFKMNSLLKMLEADKYRAYVTYDFILSCLAPQNNTLMGLPEGAKAWQDNEFGIILKELEEHLLHRTDPERPVFAYALAANVHSIMIGSHAAAIKRPHAGFNDDYAYALETVDQELGQFVEFLKQHGLYENSVVILTADHGASLGEFGRWGHITVAPEIMRIPLIIHLPKPMKEQLVWDTEKPVFLEDITPSIYYLAGHHPLKHNEMFGRPLFTSTIEEQAQQPADHYFMMSSYMPVFGVLTSDQKSLYIVDASLQRTYFYDLEHDSTASENRITVALKKKYEQVVREHLKKIDSFYRLRMSGF